MEARSGHFHHHHGEDGVDKAADGAFHHQHRASTPDAGSARSSPALDRFDGSVTPFTVSDVGRPGWVLTKQEFLEAAEMVTIIADDDFSAAGVASPPKVPPPQYPSF
ncbi:MAG: hypothetical protein IT335_01980 [Thermomicrobiales bacterium]|nr:hypothetical protein [Thermomicrobiales bacterium]